MTQHPAWLLMIFGLILAGIGVVWLIAPSIPWLGKLPGGHSRRAWERQVLRPGSDLSCDQLGSDRDHLAGSIFLAIDVVCVDASTQDMGHPGYRTTPFPLA